MVYTLRYTLVYASLSPSYTPWYTPLYTPWYTPLYTTLGTPLPTGSREAYTPTNGQQGGVYTLLCAKRLPRASLSVIPVSKGSREPLWCYSRLGRLPRASFYCYSRLGRLPRASFLCYSRLGRLPSASISLLFPVRKAPESLF